MLERELTRYAACASRTVEVTHAKLIEAWHLAQGLQVALRNNVRAAGVDLRVATLSNSP